MRQLIEGRMGVRLDLVSLFRLPTVELLAAHLSGQSGQNAAQRGSQRGAARRVRQNRRRGDQQESDQ
jgi:hypothetical protein